MQAADPEAGHVMRCRGVGKTWVPPWMPTSLTSRGHQTEVLLTLTRHTEAHTTKLRSRLLRCPSDMDKFLLCNPMRSADHESIAGPPKDSGKCGPGWPVCADLHLKVRLEGNFWRVGWC
ncbi:uncharacterized protein [Gorilla gorilla gorilla]|uniref:uncharacterized protein isoform X1 n=1 Tax=Gorilla gorilla gorilla TaxID=9595 RepID=UPI002445C7F6|nr:uncharacterized protein LOC129528518 isoform X1 [Gorilla gorilla gorilla]